MLHNYPWPTDIAVINGCMNGITISTTVMAVWWAFMAVNDNYFLIKHHDQENLTLIFNNSTTFREELQTFSQFAAVF